MLYERGPSDVVLLYEVTDSLSEGYDALRSEPGGGTLAFFFFFLGVTGVPAPVFAVCGGDFACGCVVPVDGVCFIGVKSTGFRAVLLVGGVFGLLSVVAFVAVFFFFAGTLAFKGDLVV